MPFPAIPGLDREVLDLLGAVWPRTPAAIARARGWGADWTELSTPFLSRSSSGAAVGHAGVLELRLWVDGQQLRVAGVHGVCVHPAHRGQGHFLRAMQQALEFVDRHFDCALLWTSEPALYQRFGFETWEEQIVTLRPAPRPRVPEGRRLDLDQSADQALLRRAIASRELPSTRLAAGDDGCLFLIDVALWTGPGLELVWIESLETLVAVEHALDRVRIHDVFAPRLPDLEELLGRLAPTATRCEIHLEADRWTGQGARRQPHPCLDRRVVRGRKPWTLEAESLPTLTRC